MRSRMPSNLTTQGYCIGDTQRRELWLGLRFATGLCAPTASSQTVPSLNAWRRRVGFGGRQDIAA